MKNKNKPLFKITPTEIRIPTEIIGLNITLLLECQIELMNLKYL